MYISRRALCLLVFIGIAVFIQTGFYCVFPIPIQGGPRE